MTKETGMTKQIAMESYKTDDKNWYAPEIPKADTKIRIKFKKMSKTATLPSAIRDGDIGFDVFCDEDFTMCPGDVKKIKTNIQLADMPTMDCDRNRIFMKIEGRSGLSAKGIFPTGGIIDPTYRGEIGVVLVKVGTENMGSPDYNTEKTGRRFMDCFSKGDRIAQLVIYKVATMGEAVIEESDKVTESNRGQNGFGSSGR
jgi:dUTP pyrophosphatase